MKTVLNPGPTAGPNPAASAITGFTETPRPAHQRWTQFGGAGATDPGFTGAMYEFIELPVQHRFYPDVNGIPPSTIWSYVDMATNTPGPLHIQARYGEPVVLRIHNSLPFPNDGFGINQTSTHLHNGHTASESDGGPVQFYDFGQFKDFHYANARAGLLQHPPHQ